jgi:hypothetical protein
MSIAREIPVTSARLDMDSSSEGGQPSQGILGGSAVVGSYVASERGVAEEARTRGFAAPALAGCAFVVADVTAVSATLPAGTPLVK